MAFELSDRTAGAYLMRRGLVAADRKVTSVALDGGVSANVVAARVPGEPGFVVKQALPQLRVADEWLAKPERAETETAALTLCGALTPGSVPRVLDTDPEHHILVMELVEGRSNWQAEVALGRTHADAAGWAGKTLGTWHRETAGSDDVARAFDDHEAFDQLRLDPFHRTVMARRPELAELMRPRLEELQEGRICFVHGDYAMKNMLVGDAGRTVLDFEVAHYGSPVFDVAFFLSFVVLSAVRWPAARDDMELVAMRFLDAYRSAAGDGLTRSPEDLAAHTACLVLARTDGKSIALFLDEESRSRAREVGRSLLVDPHAGLWSWA